MKKIIALILCTLGLVFALTGCVREEMQIKLNEEGTGEMVAMTALKLGFYQQLKDMNGVDPFDGKETINVEYDGEKYVAVKDTVTYASFEELENALKEMTFGGGNVSEEETDGTEQFAGEIKTEPTDTEIEIESDAIAEAELMTEPDAGSEINEEVEPAEDADSVDEYETVSSDSATGEIAERKLFKTVEIKKDRSKYSFHAVLNSVEGESFGYDISEVLKVTVTVEMPGKITAYKGGTVNGNVVKFDISDLSEETELYVESKTGSALPAVIGTVVILGGIAAFIFLRKKR